MRARDALGVDLHAEPLGDLLGELGGLDIGPFSDEGEQAIDPNPSQPLVLDLQPSFGSGASARASSSPATSSTSSTSSTSRK